MRTKVMALMVLSIFSVSTLQAAQQTPPSGTNLGSVTGGTFQEAHLVIDNKCVSCHTGQRIQEALSAGKDMQQIMQRMELKGVKLSPEEKSALRIFWKETPLRPKK